MDGRMFQSGVVTITALVVKLGDYFFCADLKGSVDGGRWIFSVKKTSFTSVPLTSQDKDSTIEMAGKQPEVYHDTPRETVEAALCDWAQEFLRNVKTRVEKTADSIDEALMQTTLARSRISTGEVFSDSEREEDSGPSEEDRHE